MNNVRNFVMKVAYSYFYWARLLQIDFHQNSVVLLCYSARRKIITSPNKGK